MAQITNFETLTPTELERMAYREHNLLAIELLKRIHRGVDSRDYSINAESYALRHAGKLPEHHGE